MICTIRTALKPQTSPSLMAMERRWKVLKNLQRYFHGCSPISRMMKLKMKDTSPICFDTPAYFSVKSRPQTLDTVTVENVLSDKNKRRVQETLKSLKEVLKFPRNWEGKPPSPQACVLIPFCTVNGEPSVLFTLRSTDLIDHRGEVR
jgi:hypothetical protein